MEESCYTSSDDGIECPGWRSQGRADVVRDGSGIRVVHVAPNGTYHIVSTNHLVEATSLLSALNERLGLPERETYRSYLKSIMIAAVRKCI